MSNNTPFETIAQRSILLAKALLSKASKEFHNDVHEHPSEGELAQALMVVMPYFASLHIPESDDGDLGAVVITAEPVDRIAMIARPCGRIGEGHGLAVSLYKPNHMPADFVLDMLAKVLLDMRKHNDEINDEVRH
jgi:hypothetical protein